MAYDAARGVTVLFGGHGKQDTWEWDGETWVERKLDGPVPSGRSNHAMAYDGSRGVTVLFGGEGLVSSKDTWEWNGETWVERTPDGPRPSARSSHAMAYDATRGVTVLFAGLSAAGEMQDTWEWDQAPQQRPGQRLSVSWPDAEADEAAVVQDVDLSWYAGGLGHESDGACEPIHGAELKAWTGLGWTTLATHEGGPEAPEALAWATTDPDEVKHLFFGLAVEETLNFAVTPAAANGCGSEYGQISTEYVEMTVGYRLPAE